MVRIPRHRAKDSATRTGLARRRLALVEEAMTQAEPAKLGQQHGLAEIEEAIDIAAGGQKGRFAGIRLSRHGRCGSHAHGNFPQPCDHQHGRLVAQKLGQIAGFIIDATIIKIGPAAKHSHAQGCERVQRHVGLANALDPDLLDEVRLHQPAFT